MAVGRKRATIANLFFQYFILISAVVNGIVLIPLYLRFIDPTLYGAWLATGNIINWLTIMDPGINDLIRQQVAKFYGNKEWVLLGKAVGTGWAAISLLSVLCVMGGSIISLYAPEWFLKTDAQIVELRHAILISSIGLGLIFISGSPGCVQQGLQRSEQYLIIYVLGWLARTVISIILLVKGYGLISIPLGGLVNGTILLLGCGLDVMLVFKRNLKVKMAVSSDYFYDMKSLLGATLLNRISRILSLNSDSFLVGLFLGVEAVPIMTFSRRLWDFAILVTERLSVAFVPGLAHMLGEGHKDRAAKIAGDILKLTFWILGTSTVVILALNASFVKMWVGSQYFAGNTFNLLSAFSTIPLVFVLCITQLLYAAEDIKRPAIAGVLQNTARIVLLVLTLKAFGLNMIPISIGITSLAAILMFFWHKATVAFQLSSQQLSRGVIAVGTGSFLGIVGAYFFHANTWVILFLLGLVCLTVFCLALAALDVQFRTFVCQLQPLRRFKSKISNTN